MPVEFTKGSLRLEDALAMEGPTGVFARLTASSALVELDRFINAEAARGVNGSDLLQALALFFVQTHASTAANMASVSVSADIRDLFKDVVEDVYVKHFRRVSQGLGERH